MKRLAVIPARAGSTRLKNKNTFPLGGKPLIRWMTEAVLESKCFDKVIISTDGDYIFDAVSDLSVERHHRPDSDATVEATVLDAMVNLMESTEEEYDVFAYFLPTCPFINHSEIRKGVEALDSSTDSVISMTEIPETLQLACLMKDDWVLPVYDNLEQGMTNSKFIKKYYKPSGAFYMGWWDTILKHRNFFKGKTRGIRIPSERSVDINNLDDIRRAEGLLP
tara:strand:- start:550 stop:1215 length:666 start_codon:yes stop_codon:yes gene_type:complete